MSTSRAVVIDVVRTPFGKGRAGGALAGVHPVDLFAGVLEELLRRTGVEPATVDDLIAGCVLQVGEQSGNIARQAWLAAGLPEQVPAVTLDRKCGSAQQALHFAAQGVLSGAYDVVVAGGVEVMSRAPMKSNRLGMDHLGPRLRARYPHGLVGQGISAELIAARWGLSREDCDGYAQRSQELATQAVRDGRTARDLVPVPVTSDDSAQVDVTADEGIRPSSTLEGLARLRPAFEDEALADRFPQIRWVVTAGNSSQVTDGASAALVMREDRARSLGLVPRAALTSFAVVGDDPLLMLMGVVPATRRLLDRSGTTLPDIDAVEVNEAFASVVLAWAAETGADLDRVNTAGGAIAYGHPVGASGGRLLAGLLTGLERRDGTLGLMTMCESGGMANAMLVERVG